MDKATLRTQIGAEPAVTAELSAMVARRVREWMSPQLPGTVTYFLAMDDEIDLSAVVAALPGWRWILPRVEVDGSLTFRDRDLPHEVHEFGMSQPLGVGPEIPISEIDLFLVPGVAFDMGGGRLGRGKGFYDRVLTQRRADAFAVGVTCKSKIVPTVPMGPKDVRVDYLAFEEGVTAASS